MGEIPLLKPEEEIIFCKCVFFATWLVKYCIAARVTFAPSVQGLHTVCAESMCWLCTVLLHCISLCPLDLS